MSVLSDTTILRYIKEGRITIDPFDPAAIESASVDVRLGRHLEVFTDYPIAIDPFEKQSALLESVDMGVRGHFHLEPGALVLGMTHERIGVPSDLVARIEGKSSLGRLGLSIHLTAGYIDPGNTLNITLEIKNELRHQSLILFPGMQIAQVAFETLTEPASVPYGTTDKSKYYGDSKPVGSKYYLNPRPKGF